jgi:hypothetical protein
MRQIRWKENMFLSFIHTVVAEMRKHGSAGYIENMLNEWQALGTQVSALLAANNN